jgi:predicted transposase/invertase (TIGR01784 family)
MSQSRSKRYRKNISSTAAIIKDHMERFINPLNDFAFKKIFGNETVLKGFLNSVMELPSPIVSIEYRSTEHKGDSPADKTVLFDLYCTDQLGRHFVIEMQRLLQLYILERMVYYTTYPIRDQITRGTVCYDLSPVYGLAILNFDAKDILPSDRAIHRVRLKDDDNNVIYDKLQLIFIELPKFKKALKELVGDNEQWLYWLAHVETLEDIPPELNAPGIDVAFGLAEYYGYDRTDRQTYLLKEKEWRDYNESIFASLKRGREEGLEQGLEQGRAEGELAGILKGKRETLRNTLPLLRQANVSLESIATMNGLSLQDVESLIAELGL